MPFTRPRHWLRWLIGGIVVLAALAVAGPFLYIHFFNGSTPAALTLSPSGGSAPAGSSASSAAMAGSWTVSSGSVVGYRVNEVLLGQNTTAVGRSTSVTGHLTIAGSTATAASFSVTMDTIRSDKSQRDDRFNGPIMNVAKYPTGTFALTSPVDLAPLPAAGTVKTYTAHGKLTLHGTTRAVTVTLTAERTATGIKVAGQIPVLFSDYNIQNPSFAGFVTTQDHGLLEFLLVFTRS